MKPVLLALMAVACLLTNCSPRHVNEPQARQLAVDTFQIVCQDLSYTSSMFTGPVRIKVAGAAFAYEWKPKVAYAKRVRISVASDGSTQTVPTD
jgi:hypothetical protein